MKTIFKMALLLLLSKPLQAMICQTKADRAKLDRCLSGKTWGPGCGDTAVRCAVADVAHTLKQEDGKSKDSSVSLAPQSTSSGGGHPKQGGSGSTYGQEMHWVGLNLVPYVRRTDGGKR